ncbi:hypothetical protein IP92_01763 [Pseudoduganella flava]|uniref:Matrixin family metalloprotease n=1 Tax=Pseudoduganella flava TaxID=871742 RepID=A0A562PVA6_9BURK|nr:hypothetical protein [Pseudoduganella flava]QGZ39486.1 hypothetical protein GO485_10805 [Pseudoduganella flava]TWI48375.1 hypothetical protein IP92_01763 [Pseudoduganella flava]
MSRAHFFKVRKTVLALALGIATLSATVSALTPGCDDIKRNIQPRIRPNSTVDIVFDPSRTAPPEFVEGMRAAIAELSQKIDGITLRLMPAEDDATVSIIVNVQGNHPKNLGDYAGIGTTGNWLATGVLNIYKDQSACGGLCLDPGNQQEYREAIKWVFMHELLHALGADHSSKANIMYDYFVGVNNRGNRNPDLPCVLPKVQSLLGGGSTPVPDPGTCS